MGPKELAYSKCQVVPGARKDRRAKNRNAECLGVTARNFLPFPAGSEKIQELKFFC
jgi:hypothetical protein